MKKTSLVILLLSVFISLFSLNTLKDVYHKNYGYIDRVVFVFDKYPNYEIIKNRKDIQINIRNCRKSEKVKNHSFPDNKVLEDFTVAAYGNDMIAIIVTDSSYVLKNFRFEEKNDFKLVLDIFAKAEPENYEEFVSFGNFYKTVGNPKKGNMYLEKATKLKEKMTEQIEADTIIQTVSADTSDNLSEKQENVVAEQSPQKQKAKIKKDRIILFFLLIVLFNVIILIFKKLKGGKKVVSEIKESSFRQTDGFGSEEFQKRMVKKLSEEGWKVREIAQELNLSETKVEKIQKELKIR